jgi:hypothetical protein
MIFFHIILLSLGNTCSEENEIYLELFNMAVKTLNLGPKSIHTDAMNKKIQTIFMACQKKKDWVLTEIQKIQISSEKKTQILKTFLWLVK